MEISPRGTDVRPLKSPKKDGDFCKKRLTNGNGGGIICRLSGSGGEPAGQRTESMKNSEKERKKLLTNRMIHDRMSKFATETERAPVPCKLNNAR